MRFSLYPVVHLQQFTSTNIMTIHFDDALRHSYMSVHMIDRVRLAKMTIKHVREQQHVVVRTSSNLWFEKGANEQFSPSCRILCKISISSEVPVIQSRTFLISSKSSVAIPIHFFSVLTLSKKS